MILWLDHFIFGNGYGLKAPYFDSQYYWLVDTSQDKRPGTLYSWIGGFGAQIKSYQWFHPIPGETRTLLNREFRVYHSERRGARVEVSWSMIGRDNDTSRAIYELKNDLIAL